LKDVGSGRGETGGGWLCVCFAGGMRQLLVWIQRNLLKERPELFVQGDSVCLLLPFTIKPIILLSLLRSCDF
uniref:Uncharacterized protein n=1 Tax=Oryzias sinensis TaxID=183150 RepID=A0A8C7YB40_9TELE